MKNKIQNALEKFDAYNKLDPKTIIWQQETYPQEYFLATKLYEWVLKLDPQPSDALILASKSQHLGRWELSRSEFPMDKAGYLEWRKRLALHHAEKATAILNELEFPTDIIDEVNQIILKKKIKFNPEVQTMENALCLVFLNFQYEDFFPKHPDKIVNILKRSLLKMDANGHSFALELPYSAEGLKHIQAALALLTTKE